MEVTEANTEETASSKVEAPDEILHTADEIASRPNDAPECDRNRDSGRERGESADLLRTASEHRIAERGGSVPRMLESYEDQDD